MTMTPASQDREQAIRRLAAAIKTVPAERQARVLFEAIEMSVCPHCHGSCWENAADTAEFIADALAGAAGVGG